MTTITSPLVTLSGPKHLAGLKDATTLNTAGLRSIRRSISQLVEEGGIILIDGKPIIGKVLARDKACISRSSIIKDVHIQVVLG